MSTQDTNNQRVREALEQALAAFEKIHSALSVPESYFPEWRWRDLWICSRSMAEICRTALAAPARNCDRFCGDPDRLVEACLRERGLGPEEDFPRVYSEWLLAAEKGDIHV